MDDALEAAARDALPFEVYEYFRAGVGDEVTLSEQRAAWSRVRFRPHVLNDVSVVDTSVTVLGASLAAPIVVGPTALQVLADPEGEVATARAVGAAGSLLVLSTRSGRRLDDVAAAGAPFWQQLYVLRDRGISDEIARRAADAGARALVVTLDVPFVSAKTIPIPATPTATRLVPELERGGRSVEQAPDVVTADLARLASVSGLPVVAKGVLRGDDARRCRDAGASAVIVSTHGGRQLDQAVSVPAALPDVVAAVGDDLEVYADGGIRRGTDVLAALGLGARAVLLGRPVLWALAAGGAPRVEQLLDELRTEFGAALALAGLSSTSAVDADLIYRG